MVTPPPPDDPETGIALAFCLRCNEPRGDYGDYNSEPLELIQEVHMVFSGIVALLRT